MTLLARQQQVQRRDGSRPGMQMLEVGGVMKLFRGTAEACGLTESIERAGFRRAPHLRRARAAAGDDVDDPADGVRSVQAALRAAQDLDPLDVLTQELAEIERRAAAARIG